MQAMIPFPDISPEIFSISLFGMEFALRWYALAYIAGISGRGVWHRCGPNRSRTC
jgi:prolipoprotein diacylglyceryltransferase